MLINNDPRFIKTLITHTHSHTHTHSNCPSSSFRKIWESGQTSFDADKVFAHKKFIIIHFSFSFRYKIVYSAPIVYHCTDQCVIPVGHSTHILFYFIFFLYCMELVCSHYTTVNEDFGY